MSLVTIVNEVALSLGHQCAVRPENPHTFYEDSPLEDLWVDFWRNRRAATQQDQPLTLWYIQQIPDGRGSWETRLWCRDAHTGLEVRASETIGSRSYIEFGKRNRQGEEVLLFRFWQPGGGLGIYLEVIKLEAPDPFINGLLRQIGGLKNAIDACEIDIVTGRKAL